MIDSQQFEKDVSIIIVCYNSLHLLRQCLDGLVKFTSDINYEIIVVDNNTTEGSTEETVSNLNSVVLIKNKDNKGFAAANNQGLAIARGKYVLFLNNDVIFLDNSIKKVYEFAETLKEQIIVGCKLLNSDKTIQYSVYDYPTLLNVFTSNFFLYLLFPKSKFFNKYHQMNKGIIEPTEVQVVTGAFLFSHTYYIKQLGGFDERFTFYNEETDLCYRFFNAGGKIYYYPNTSLIHLKGATANKNLTRRYKNESFATIRYFQKHFNGFSYFLACFAHYTGMLIRIPIFSIAGIIRKDKVLIIRAFSNLRNLFSFPTNAFKNPIVNRKELSL